MREKKNIRKTTGLPISYFIYKYTKSEKRYFLKQFSIMNSKYAVTWPTSNWNSKKTWEKYTHQKNFFYADSKYTMFNNFYFTHSKLRAWENLPHIRKRRQTPPKIQAILMKITP